MTYQEISAMPEYQAFLAKLRETPRDWHLTVNGEIRLRNFVANPPCPGVVCGTKELAIIACGLTEAA
jgi:hypothetical protein